MSESAVPNRLSSEKSPYLLQHARNPVGWYPWGGEAISVAQRKNIPIFLSVGYSTCHWCHVMERQCFEDPEIAEMLNRHFVPVKVDREERPDIDFLYMQAVIAMTGAGGWPLTVFLTPELNPFYGATYIPPEDKYGKPGLKTILKGVSAHWESDPATMMGAGKELLNLLRFQGSFPGAEDSGNKVSAKTIQDAVNDFEAVFDAEEGGFSKAPKFPSPHILSFLLLRYQRSGDRLALRMAEKTLESMARGGIRDHIGGGFHRYATDRQWRIPHFEKMLYDQAQISRAYLEVYGLTRNERFALVAESVLEFVIKEMTDGQGGFYSALDADSLSPGSSEKKEGAFYLWSASEIRSLLEGSAAGLVADRWGIAENGNVPEDPFGEFGHGNVLYEKCALGDLTAAHGKTEAEVAEILESSRRAILDARMKRPAPHLDTKVLTDWNGLMISSFALASAVLGKSEYEEMARRAADFILTHLKDPRGGLFHRWCLGEAGIPGFLDDYAFFGNALLDLYQVTFDLRYLVEASSLAEDLIRLFDGSGEAGFYFTARDGVVPMFRPRVFYDSALPSGNSVAIYFLLRMGRVLGRKEFEETAARFLAALGPRIARAATAHAFMLMALDLEMNGTTEIVLTGERGDPETVRLMSALKRHYSADKLFLFLPSNEPDTLAELMRMNPGLERFSRNDASAQVYVCRNFRCEHPVKDPGELEKLLSRNPSRS